MGFQKCNTLYNSKDTQIAIKTLSVLWCVTLILETQFHLRVPFHYQPSEKGKLTIPEANSLKNGPLGSRCPAVRQGTHWPRGHRLTQGPHPTGIKRNKSCKYYFLIGHSRFCESYILRERRRKTSQCQTSQASESASIPDLWLMWQLKTNHAEGNLDRTSVSFSIHPPYTRRGGRGAGRAVLPPCSRQKLQANCIA